MKPGVNYIGISTAFYCFDSQRNLLLHKRSKNCRDEQGKWDCGAGQMRLGETFEHTVRREIKEEYGAKIKKLKLCGINNVIRKHKKDKTHWIVIIFYVLVDKKTVKNNEPDKIDEIDWFKLNNLPSPKHSMLLTHLKMVKDARLI